MLLSKIRIQEYFIINVIYKSTRIAVLIAAPDILVLSKMNQATVFREEVIIRQAQVPMTLTMRVENADGATTSTKVAEIVRSEPSLCEQILCDRPLGKYACADKVIDMVHK